MLLPVLGGLLLFGISENMGEVYHGYHVTDEKNPVMYTARKIADGSEVIEEKVTTTKANIQAKMNLKKASTVKTIEDAKDVSNINDALDNMINNINANKNAEVMSVLSQAAADLGKACDVIIDDDIFEQLNKTEAKSITDAKNRTVEIINKINAGELSDAQAKDQIKKLADKITAVAVKVNEIEQQAAQSAPNNASVQVAVDPDAPKIPNFVKEEKKASDIKVADVKKTAGTKAPAKSSTNNSRKNGNTTRKNNK